jgi:rhamnosyltransferase
LFYLHDFSQKDSGLQRRARNFEDNIRVTHDPLSFAQLPLGEQSRALRIGALIVTYFPDQDLLTSLQATLLQSASQVCIVNNSPTPLTDMGAIFNRSSPNGARLICIELGENRGIAYAQNQGLRTLFQNGCEATFIFDQDSTIDPSFVAQMLTAWQALEQRVANKIAAIGPAYIDRKTGMRSAAIRYCASGMIKRIALVAQTQPIEADYVIASGSLIPRYAWERAGAIAEPLFAYWLDIEWGLRAKALGLNSYVIPSTTMSHSIGKDTVTVFGRARVVHDDFRQYFLIRNPLLLLRYQHLPRMVRLRILFEALLKYIPWYWLTSSNKTQTWQTLRQAFCDGYRNRGGGR